VGKGLKFPGALSFAAEGDDMAKIIERIDVNPMALCDKKAISIHGEGARMEEFGKG
jgi:hypothetical protein